MSINVKNNSLKTKDTKEKSKLSVNLNVNMNSKFIWCSVHYATNIIGNTFKIGPNNDKEEVKNSNIILVFKHFESLIEEKLLHSEKKNPEICKHLLIGLKDGHGMTNPYTMTSYWYFINFSWRYFLKRYWWSSGWSSSIKNFPGQISFSTSSTYSYTQLSKHEK